MATETAMAAAAGLSSLTLTPPTTSKRAALPAALCRTSTSAGTSTSSSMSSISSSMPCTWRRRRRRRSALSWRKSETPMPACSAHSAATTSTSLGGSSSLQQEEEPPLIELKGVHKAFGSKKILAGADLVIREGEAVGIIGPSGTGKSTILKIMAGLLEPDRGEVWIRGVQRSGLASDTGGAEMEGVRIGMVFQSAALFDSLTVAENVGFVLYEHSKLPERRIKELVSQSLARVGLSGIEDVFPANLSGGMRKRVALARAIISDDTENDSGKIPEIVMYDEPTAGLDPIASTVVEDLIRKMQERGPTGQRGVESYIVVTHQHSTIRRAVDRIVFLHQGRVAWEGPVEEFDTSDNELVRQFATGSLEGPIRWL
eukprot:jgi/Chlat1/3529/Chrsp23S03801